MEQPATGCPDTQNNIYFNGKCKCEIILTFLKAHTCLNKQNEERMRGDMFSKIKTVFGALCFHKSVPKIKQKIISLKICSQREKKYFRMHAF